MVRIRFDRPAKRSVLRLCAVGTALISLALLTVRITRIDTVPADWVATTAKYVGLIVSSILGVVGTATDTKELRSDGRYRLRPVGWVVVVSIVVALVVGALGQHYESEQQDRREAEQVKRLQDIAILSQQSLKRFSGKIEVRILVALSLDQPYLRGVSAGHDKTWTRELREAAGIKPGSFLAMQMFAFPETVVFERAIQEELSHLRWYITLGSAVPPFMPKAVLMSVKTMTASPEHVRIVEYNPDTHVVKAIMRIANTATTNHGIYSAADFISPYVEVKYADLMEPAASERPAALARVPSLHVAAEELALYDGELQNSLGFAQLSPGTFKDGWLGGGDIGRMRPDPGQRQDWEEGDAVMYSLPAVQKPRPKSNASPP